MFNIEDQEQSLSFEPIVPGFYKFCVTGAKMKERDNGSEFFEFILETDDSQKVWHRTIWTHHNETAQRIGRQQLADLLAAVGVTGFKDPEDLQEKLIAKEFIGQVTQEVYNGKVNAKLSSAWSLEGNHRNPKRNLTEIKLGPDHSATIATSKPKEDVPF